MADEMSDEAENDAEFLEYKLCSFQSDFQLYKIRNIVLCTRNRLLVIHYADSRLSIVRAGNYDQELKAETDVREIYYHDDDNSLTTLCLLHNNGNLSVYALEDNLRCIASWNELALSTVLSDQGLVLPNTSSLPFVLGCTRSRLMVLAQEEDGRLLTPAEEQPTNDVSGATSTTEPPVAGRVASLLLSSKSTGKLECGYTIALPTHFEDCHVVPSVQLHQSTLSILDWAQHALYLYDIEDGTCFLQVNLHSIVHLCSSMPKFWRVSNDDIQLFLISEINSAICFSLRDLYSFRPEDCKFSFPSTDLPQTAEHRKWSRIHKYGYCIPMIQKSSALNSSSAENGAKKRVSGLKKCLPSVTLDDKIKVMQLPEFLEQHHATDIVVSPTVGKVLFTSEENVNAAVLWMCDFTTGNVRLKRFKKGSGHVVLGMEQCHPPLILREGGLYAMVDGLLQEEFIDKVMTYGGARVTDELCQMNKWGRCSLPLRALELGLKYRQLDTISVFLRTRQNLFSNKSLDGMQTDSIDQSSVEGNGHLLSLRRLEPAYQILLRSIEENMAEQQSLFFAQQLLGVMLNHLYCLLNDALSVQNLQPDDNIPDDEQDETDQAMDIVMDYISNVRSYMTTLGQKRQNTLDEDDVPSGMSHSIISMDQESSNWADMDVMDAIEDGIRKNIVPVAQDYLLQQNLPQLAQLSEVFRLGLLRSIEYLQRGQFEDASLLISNLGFSPNDKYWSFAQYTNDHTLRDCILNYLSKTGEEKEIMTFFCKLQEAYPCTSFERVKENLIPLGGWKGLDPVASCMTINPSQYDLKSSCGEISPDQQHIPASLHNNRYCDVLLDWLLSWSTDVQQLVLLDAQMTSQNCSVQYPDIPNHVMWEYLVSHNRIDAALNWLSEQITSKKEGDCPNDTTLSYQQILHTVKTSATSYLGELIYMQLARNGVFDSSVQTGKFGRFLQLLCQLGGVLKDPSPLSLIDNVYIELRHFHQDFISYCTEHRFGYLLWKYCDKNEITPKQLSLQLFDDQHIMWIKMFQNFYSLSLNSYDISPMYEASLANAGVVWNLQESTIAGLVQQGHVLAALATTLYGNDLLTSMTSSLGVPDPFQGIDMDTLEDSLLQFPRLHDALFPTSIKKASQYDITVYQLLRGNSPFDPARLFGWHSTNTVAGEDSLKVMPHFSLPELVSKYAQPEGIQFTYYLRQGRPTFAFCSFVSEEFTHGTVLAPHRIQAACWIATKIGVKSFHQPQIAASCSAFIEMLGGNSILLRLLVDVGNKVVNHKNAKLKSWGGGIQWRKDYCKQHEEETGRLLMACFKRRGDSASELLYQLEDSIMLKLEEEDVSPFSFEAGHMWTLSVLLCIQLHLPYPTKYLEICASTNNWLPFLWFAQLHQYPKEQLHQMVSWFPNSHLRDHIFYVLNNAQNRFLAEVSTPAAGGEDTKRPKAFRSGFYSRLGVNKSVDATQSSSDEEEDTLSLASFKDEIKDSDLEFELKPGSAAEDVFRVIFSAQATKCLWKSLLAHGIALRNPLFTELAACQKDANILSCLCGWLLSVMDPPRHTQFLMQHSHIVTKWSLDHLRELMEIFLNNNWTSNLATGFAIFQMETPLAFFLKFLSSCIEKHNYSECHNLLEQFKHSLLCKPKGEKTSVNQMPPNFSMIGDLHWQEHTCQCLVRHLLASLLNIYDILQLLKYLHQCNITSVFTSLPGLNYGQLLKVAQIVHENQLSISFHLFLVSDQKLLTSQLEPLVTNIVNKKLYDDARMLCEFAKISHEDVTMKEVVSEKEELQKSHAWLSELVRINFWKECLHKFTEYGVSAMKVVQFFLTEIRKCQNGSSNMNEQAIMYELCVKSLLDAPDPSGNLYANTVNELSHKMWYCRIMARVPKIERIPSLVAPIDEMFIGLEEIPPSHLKTSALKTELLQHGKMPNVSQKPSEFSDSEQRALSLLIGELLDEARLSDCCRIAAEFCFYSQDLAIILTCIRLSIGSISVDEIVPEVKQLLSQSADINMNTTKGFSRQLSNGASLFRLSTASIGSLTGVGNLTLTPEQEQKITIMEQLYGLCVQGKQCCRRVLTAKKIALVLSRKYEFVITSDEFTILEMLLKVENSVRFHLAKEFLATSTVTDAQLAGFLADAILKSLKICAPELRSPDSNSPTAVEHDLIFNPIGPAGGDSQQFLQLCQDPSRLGDRLLDAVASLASDTNQDVLTVQTQLLILAHRCHTAACNMEGISNVLRAARVLNQCLSQAEEFNLMIQLLTGVGRFNEMTYIFDALKQHHQFELLLRKGMEKEDQLKVAILDYLKRFHANDSDSYTMVAFNFTMFREIGQMLEELAQKNLIILKRKPLVNSAEVGTTLHKIHQYFSDAAKSFMKDNILRHAESCVRQARLVQLQLDLLSSGIHVINLTPEDAVNFIIQHPKFSEALVVSEAYNKTAVWGEALCNRVIIHGDFRYLQDLKAYIRLNPILIIDTIDRYKQLPHKPSQCEGNIKKLLTYCKDLRLQYQIARELGLKDFLTQLETGTNSAYIMDIASSRGSAHFAF